jgi:hypothetical protein
MPYREEYYPREIFLEVEETIIYRSYKNNMIDEPLYYYFTLDPSEDEGLSFDIRDFTKRTNIYEDGTTTWRERVLKKAVEMRLLPGQIEQICSARKNGTRHNCLWEGLPCCNCNGRSLEPEE